MPKQITITPEHATNIRNALTLIEHQAQAAIRQACEELCDVPGMCAEWEAACKLHSQVKAVWHKVEAKRRSLMAVQAKPGFTARE